MKSQVQKSQQEFNQRKRNDLPTDWHVFTINELKKEEFIYQLQDGNHGELHPKKQDYSSNGRPFLTANSIGLDGTINVKEAPRLPEDYCKKLRIGFIKPGDVLFTHNATVGRVAIVPDGIEDCVIGTSITYHRLNTNKISKEYYAYSLQSPFFKSQLDKIMFQTTRSQVPITAQGALIVIVPPLEEQQKIAAILSKVDELIQKTDQIIEQTQRLKKGLMQELLTKGIGHTKFKKTPIGEIPEEWVIASVSELCIVRKPDEISSNLYIGLEHMDQANNSLVSTGETKDFTSNKHIFHRGDILYGKLRPNLNKVYLAKEDGYCSADILPLAIKGGLLGEILLWVLSSNRFVDYAISTSSGTKMPRTNWNDIKDFRLSLPPLEEQQQIISVVSKIIFITEKRQKYRLSVEYLKKGLMQKLLTGKIRVKV